MVYYKYLKGLAGYFIMLSVFCESLCAQTAQREDVNSLVFKIGTGINISTAVDKNFSSLSFNGKSIGYLTSLKYVHDKFYNELEFYFANGRKSTEIKPAETLEATCFNADYSALYKISSSINKACTYKIGGGADIMYAKRVFNNFINNNASFEFAASFSAVAEFVYFFDNNSSGFSVHDRISVPVVSIISQSSFGSNTTDGNTNENGNSFKDIISAGNIAGFSSFFRIKNCTSLEKIVSNTGKLSLCYTWDFYRLHNTKQVMQANHRIELIYSYIF
jgi:hypothetical protein